MRFPTFSLLLSVAAVRLSAAEFSLQTVDGLSRPISGVQVEVSCTTPKHKSLSLSLKSDQDGMAHGTYDAALCTPAWVSVQKQGYASYSSGFRERYILRRLFS